MCRDVGGGVQNGQNPLENSDLMNSLLNNWENVLEPLTTIIRIRFFGFTNVCNDKYCSNLLKRKMTIRKFLLKGS